MRKQNTGTIHPSNDAGYHTVNSNASQDQLNNGDNNGFEVNQTQRLEHQRLLNTQVQGPNFENIEQVDDPTTSNPFQNKSAKFGSIAPPSLSFNKIDSTFKQPKLQPSGLYDAGNDIENSSESYFKKIIYNIDLDESLYSFQKSCYIDDSSPFIPVVFKLKRPEMISNNEDYDYQLQIWNKYQELIYVQPLKYNIKTWQSCGNNLIYTLEDPLQANKAPDSERPPPMMLDKADSAQKKAITNATVQEFDSIYILRIQKNDNQTTHGNTKLDGLEDKKVDDIEIPVFSNSYKSQITKLKNPEIPAQDIEFMTMNEEFLFLANKTQINCYSSRLMRNQQDIDKNHISTDFNKPKQAIVYNSIFNEYELPNIQVACDKNLADIKMQIRALFYKYDKELKKAENIVVFQKADFILDFRIINMIEKKPELQQSLSLVPKNQIPQYKFEFTQIRETAQRYAQSRLDQKEIKYFQYQIVEGIVYAVTLRNTTNALDIYVDMILVEQINYDIIGNFVNTKKNQQLEKQMPSIVEKASRVVQKQSNQDEIKVDSINDYSDSKEDDKYQNWLHNHIFDIKMSQKAIYLQVYEIDYTGFLEQRGTNQQSYDILSETEKHNYQDYAVFEANTVINELALIPEYKLTPKFLQIKLGKEFNVCYEQAHEIQDSLFSFQQSEQKSVQDFINLYKGFQITFIEEKLMCLIAHGQYVSVVEMATTKLIANICYDRQIFDLCIQQINNKPTICPIFLNYVSPTDNNKKLENQNDEQQNPNKKDEIIVEVFSTQLGLVEDLEDTIQGLFIDEINVNNPLHNITNVHVKQERNKPFEFKKSQQLGPQLLPTHKGIQIGDQKSQTKGQLYILNPIKNQNHIEQKMIILYHGKKIRFEENQNLRNIVKLHVSNSENYSNHYIIAREGRYVNLIELQPLELFKKNEDTKEIDGYLCQAGIQKGFFLKQRVVLNLQDTQFRGKVKPIHSAFTYRMEEHIIVYTEQQCIVTKKNAPTQIIDLKTISAGFITDDANYLLCSEGRDKSSYGLKMMDVQKLIDQQKSQVTELKECDIGQVSLIKVYRDYERIGFLRGISNYLVMPYLHQNNVKLIAKENLLPDIVLDVQFENLNICLTTNSLASWDIRTGKLEQIFKLPKDKVPNRQSTIISINSKKNPIVKELCSDNPNQRFQDFESKNINKQFQFLQQSQDYLIYHKEYKKPELTPAQIEEEKKAAEKKKKKELKNKNKNGKTSNLSVDQDNQPQHTVDSSLKQIQQVMSEYLVISIQDDKTIQETVFYTDYFENQKMYINEDFSKMLIITQFGECFLYKKYVSKPEKESKKNKPQKPVIIPVSDSPYRVHQWSEKQRIWDLPTFLEYKKDNFDLHYLSPSFKYYVKFDKIENLFKIKYFDIDTTQTFEAAIISRDYLHASTNDEARNVFKSFGWINDKYFRIVNDEGYERFFDVQDVIIKSVKRIIFKEIDFNARPLFDEKAFNDLQQPFYKMEFGTGLDTLKNLKELYQEYKSDLVIFQILKDQQLNESLIYRYSNKICLSNIQTFTYNNWVIIERLAQSLDTISETEDEDLQQIIYNILPNGNTILHFLQHDYNLVYELYTHCHDNDGIIYHIPFLPNFIGETLFPLSLHPFFDPKNVESPYKPSAQEPSLQIEIDARQIMGAYLNDEIQKKKLNQQKQKNKQLQKQNQELRTNLLQIFTFLRHYEIDHHSRYVQDMYSHIIQQKTKDMLDYFDTRFIKTKQMSKVNNGVLKDPLYISFPILSGSYLESLKAKKKNENTIIEINVLDMPKIYHINDPNFINLIKLLETTEAFDVFDNKAIQAIIDLNYPLVRNHVLVRFIIPFFVFHIIYVLYTNIVFEHRNYDDQYILANYVLAIAQLVFSAFFLTNELMQVYNLGWRYFMQFWNYVDIIAPSLVAVLQSLQFAQDYDVEIDPVLLRCILVFATFFMWIKLLSVLRVFESTGYLIRMIHEVIIDMGVFLLILLITVTMFADTFMRLSDGNDDEENQFTVNFIDAIMYSYSMILGGYDFENFGNFIRPLVYFFWVLCTILDMIVMLNLLIAIISATFEEQNDNKKSAEYAEKAAIIAENHFVLVQSFKESYQPEDEPEQRHNEIIKNISESKEEFLITQEENEEKAKKFRENQEKINKEVNSKVVSIQIIASQMRRILLKEQARINDPKQYEIIKGKEIIKTKELSRALFKCDIFYDISNELQVSNWNCFASGFLGCSQKDKNENYEEQYVHVCKICDFFYCQECYQEYQSFHQHELFKMPHSKAKILMEPRQQDENDENYNKRKAKIAVINLDLACCGGEKMKKHKCSREDKDYEDPTEWLYYSRFFQYLCESCGIKNKTGEQFNQREFDDQKETDIRDDDSVGGYDSDEERDMYDFEQNQVLGRPYVYNDEHYQTQSEEEETQSNESEEKIDLIASQQRIQEEIERYKDEINKSIQQQKKIRITLQEQLQQKNMQNFISNQDKSLEHILKDIIQNQQ
eukprot:403374696